MNSDIVSFPTPKASSSNESQTLLNSLLLQIHSQQNCPSSEEKPKAAKSPTKTVPKRKFHEKPFSSPTTETKKNKTKKKVTAPGKKCKRQILSDTDDEILNENLLNENNFLQ
jgi:hypothetical protein